MVCIWSQVLAFFGGSDVFREVEFPLDDMSLSSHFWPPDPYEPHPQSSNRNIFLANFGEIAARVCLSNVHNLKLHLRIGRVLAEANCNLIR